MKIGIIETGLPPHSIGGAEIQAWKLAQHLSCNYNIYMFVRKVGDGLNYEQSGNIIIHRIPVCPQKPFGIISYLLGMFIKLVRVRKKINVLLCFRAWPNGIIGFFAMLVLGIPACFSIRGGDWYFVEPKWWGKIINSILFSSSMVITVQSKKIRDEVTDKYPTVKPLIIPNGIEKSEKNDNLGKYVLFVGNLISRKGVDVLIQAVKEIPGCPLMIVGDGPERSRLEKLAGGFDITFYGHVNPQEVLPLMGKYGKLMVLPAIAGEGFPNVLLEAMSIGIPVIASNVAGVSDLLEDGYAGILVEPGNVIELRNAILSMMNDEKFRKKTAHSGYEAAQKYCWKNVTPRWIKLFSEMIEKA